MTVITLKAYWLHSERHVTASRATQCYVASRRSENSEITVTGKEKKLPVKDYSYFTKENTNFGKPWHRQSHIGRWTDSTRRKFWEFTIVLYRCYCVLSIFPGLCSILPPPLPPQKNALQGHQVYCTSHTDQWAIFLICKETLKQTVCTFYYCATMREGERRHLIYKRQVCLP